MSRKALVIPHHEGEHAGNLVAPMREFGFEIEEWRAFAGESSPLSGESVDLLVILGGIMGANDEAEHPWLLEELRLVERALKSGTQVIGLCLGGQILARVLGARVYRAEAVELGYPQIMPTGAAPALAPFAANEWRALQWHQDAFDLPAGARRLAESAMTPNQGFAYGDNCLALQFHPEASEAMVRGWLAKGSAAVAAAGYDMEDVLGEVSRWAPRAERAGAEMMEIWLGERFERLRPRARAGA
jgi:GMP synthase (glutamine-hydrolysing)